MERKKVSFNAFFRFRFATKRSRKENKENRNDKANRFSAMSTIFVRNSQCICALRNSKFLACIHSHKVLPKIIIKCKKLLQKKSIKKNCWILRERCAFSLLKLKRMLCSSVERNSEKKETQIYLFRDCWRFCFQCNPIPTNVIVNWDRFYYDDVR